MRGSVGGDESAPRSGMGPEPQNEKWGRPCGRPHSRRLVGPEGHLAARRLDAGSQKLLRALKVGFHSPGARAGAGSVGSRNRSRGPTSCRPAVPRPHVVDLYLKRLSFGPKALRNPRFKPANPAFPILRPRGINGLGFGLHQDEPLSCSASHPSTTRHLAVASIRFQNPFFLAGLSAFVSEGPIPVSMFGRCAVQPIRATAGPPIYPHST